MQVAVQSIDSKEVKKFSVPKAIAEVEPREDIIARVVRWQRAKRQAGTHQTKSIGDIRGTTAKPWRQKGTGRARQGSLRSPQFRGGAVIFGPQTRSHAHKLPKKVRQLGLKMALNQKIKDKKLIILDGYDKLTGKTKELLAMLKAFDIQSALFVDGASVNDNLRRASNGVKNVQALPQIGLNVYDILKHDVVVVSEESLNAVIERLN